MRKRTKAKAVIVFFNKIVYNKLKTSDCLKLKTV